MSSPEPPLAVRTAAALAQLTPVAKDVTAAAEELAKPLNVVDNALKQLHVAFAAWVTYKSAGEDEDFWRWDVGYSRIKGRWGIAVRTVRGNVHHPEDAEIEEWHFNESPLYLRHPAIAKLPELLEALAKTGATVARKLTNAAANATEIAETVVPPTKGKK